jgi:hypothetical protein
VGGWVRESGEIRGGSGQRIRGSSRKGLNEM